MSSAAREPTVSVVIPTVGRTSLRAAVSSVLGQAGVLPEVLVVLDAPEQRSVVTRMLNGLSYRLLITDRKGAPVARNTGLREASGEYVAFLDDDDLWLPGKAICQITAIVESPEPSFTISVARTEFVKTNGTVARKAPKTPTVRASTFTDDLVSRRAVNYGSNYFSTPTFLAPLALMQSISWDVALRKHQDWDLLARLVCEMNVSVTIVPAPLVRVHQGSPGSISARRDWRDGAAWLIKHDSKLKSRGRADFILLHVLLHAVWAHSWMGVSFSLRQLRWRIPHFGASIRFLAGLLLGR